MRTAVYIDGFNLYYRALKGTPFKWLNIHTLCESVLPKSLKIHFGSFQTQNKWMFLNQPVNLRPGGQGALSPNPKYACVVKTEEKGSDVNLGVHMVRDAFMGKFDHIAVITNDTDLAEPLRIVTQEAKLPVTLICPTNRAAATLSNHATHVRHLTGYLSANQFIPRLVLPDGSVVIKPSDW